MDEGEVWHDRSPNVLPKIHGRSWRSEQFLTCPAGMTSGVASQMYSTPPPRLSLEARVSGHVFKHDRMSHREAIPSTLQLPFSPVPSPPSVTDDVARSNPLASPLNISIAALSGSHTEYMYSFA